VKEGERSVVWERPKKTGLLNADKRALKKVGGNATNGIFLDTSRGSQKQLDSRIDPAHGMPTAGTRGASQMVSNREKLRARDKMAQVSGEMGGQGNTPLD